MIEYTLDDLKANWETLRSDIAGKKILMEYYQTKSLVDDTLKPMLSKMKQELQIVESIANFVEAKIEKYAEKK